MRSPTTNVLYILECLHVMPGTRASEGKLLCYKCEELRVIKGVHVYEWHAFCQARNCNWGRWCGLSKETAAFMARRHSVAKNHDTNAEYAPSPEGLDAEKRLIKAGVIK
jgi:hypothetical protein